MLELDDYPGIGRLTDIMDVFDLTYTCTCDSDNFTRSSISNLYGFDLTITSHVPGTSLPSAHSPVLSAEGALDAAAADRAAVRIHGLAVAWTRDAVFYVRAAPEHWEAVAAVLERGGRQHACGGALGNLQEPADPGRGPQEEGAPRKGARRTAEKATHAAKAQLKALAGRCLCEGGRCVRSAAVLLAASALCAAQLP